MGSGVTADGGVRLRFEPGRVIVGNAGALLSQVVRVKQGASQPFIIVDAAMNDLLRPSIYDAWHDIRAIKPKGKREEDHDVGPVCETGDTLDRHRDMEQAQAGDILAFMKARHARA